MTEHAEQGQGSSAEQMPTTEIKFAGRMMAVRAPDPGQMLVWKRTLTRLQEANVTEWTGAQVLNALERLRIIIDSLLLDEADKDWLDDQLLRNKIGFKDLGQIPTLAAEAVSKLTAPNNRAERRDAAKKTGPARRVPAKKTTAAKKSTAKKAR